MPLRLYAFQPKKPIGGMSVLALHAFDPSLKTQDILICSDLIDLLICLG